MSSIKVEKGYQSQRFKKARNALGLTQEKMALSLDVPVHRIKSIETGKVKLSLDIALLLEEKFNLNIRWLLTGEGPMWTSPSSDTILKNIQEILSSLPEDDLLDILAYAKKIQRLRKLDETVKKLSKNDKD